LEHIFAIIFSLPPLETLLTLGILVVAKAFDSRLRTYATYILSNPETGQVYIGRCSGYGNLEKIIFRRLYSHKYYKRGFTVIQLDKAIQGKKAKRANRGREQQLLDFYGGTKNPNVANKIRAVSFINPLAYTFHLEANKHFGQIAEFRK
jgi:hypothetical protein